MGCLGAWGTGSGNAKDVPRASIWEGKTTLVELAGADLRDTAGTAPKMRAYWEDISDIINPLPSKIFGAVMRLLPKAKEFGIFELLQSSQTLHQRTSGPQPEVPSFWGNQASVSK